MKLNKNTKNKNSTLLLDNPKQNHNCSQNSLSPPNNNLEEDDYDYDFSDDDFSLYESEEKEEIKIESIDDIDKNIPKITNYKSKYGNSIQEVEDLRVIKQEITKYAIRVSSYTQQGNDLWLLYGCLEEYWSKIKILFGSVIRNDILSLQEECKKLLNEYTNKGKQSHEVNNKLIYLKNRIYDLSQRAGLGLEIEKINNFRSQAKKGIVE